MLAIGVGGGSQPCCSPQAALYAGSSSSQILHTPFEIAGAPAGAPASSLWSSPGGLGRLRIPASPACFEKAYPRFQMAVAPGERAFWGRISAAPAMPDLRRRSSTSAWA